MKPNWGIWGFSVKPLTFLLSLFQKSDFQAKARLVDAAFRVTFACVQSEGPHPTAAAARCKSHQGCTHTAASTCTFSPSTSHVSTSQQHQSTTHVNTEGCRVADAFTQGRRSHMINTWGRSFHTSTRWIMWSIHHPVKPGGVQMLLQAHGTHSCQALPSPDAAHDSCRTQEPGFIQRNQSCLILLSSVCQSSERLARVQTSKLTMTREIYNKRWFFQSWEFKKHWFYTDF